MDGYILVVGCLASIQRHLADAVPSGDIHGAEQRDRDQQRCDEQGGDTIETDRPRRAW